MLIAEPKLSRARIHAVTIRSREGPTPWPQEQAACAEPCCPDLGSTTTDGRDWIEVDLSSLESINENRNGVKGTAADMPRPPQKDHDLGQIHSLHSETGGMLAVPASSGYESAHLP